jgi:hypothetical protein
MSLGRWLGLAALSVVLGGAGCVALYFEVSMSMDFWSSLALTKAGAEKMAWSAVALSAFAALFSLASGVLSGQGRKVLSWCVAVFAIGLTLYNATSVIGFQLKERVGNSLKAQQVNQQIARDTEMARMDASDRSAQFMSWLQATYAGARRSGDKSDLLATMKETVAKPTVVEAPKQDVVLHDVQATVIANHLYGSTDPKTIEDVQLKMVGSFSLLLAIGTVIAFWLAGAVWPTVDHPGAAAAKPDEEGEEGKPAATPARFPEPRPAVNLDAQRSKAKGAGKSKRSPITDAERALVAEFFEDARAAGRPGNETEAATAHEWFCDYARAKGRPGMNLTRFGRLAAEAVPGLKFNDGRSVFYRGLARPAFALLEEAA